MEERRINECLAYIGKALNDQGILWGLGGSMLLKQHGLAVEPHDIDLIVSLKDIEKADQILQVCGEKKSWKENKDYSTKYFYEYVARGVEIDLMAGLAIPFEAGLFEYLFDHQSIAQRVEIDGVEIPFTSLEDWFVLYQLFPNRESKVKMIEQFLPTKGLRHPALLQRVLKESLPEGVRTRITRILNL